jgi:3',5'-cyclic AMP phosphodiesterase CpdA
MSEPLALVLSDLHFGEESSVLHYGQKYKKGEQPLVNRLVELIKGSSANKKVPFLIIAGDMLDLSLASIQDAVTDFRMFAEDVHKLFDNFVYIPGNHDHHIWRTLQEQIFVVNRINERRPVDIFPHEQVGAIEDGKIILKGVDPNKILGAKTFLSYLLPRPSKNQKQKNFALVYPNLFLKFKHSEKNVLITHGHFFGTPWTFISDIFKKSLNLTTINYRVLERINSPFTELIWYSLGQAGKLSRFIEQLYEEIKSSKDEKLNLALNDVRNYLDDLWTFEPAKRKGFLSGIVNVFSEAKAAAKEELSDQGLNLATSLARSLVISQIEERGPHTSGSPLRHCANILDDPQKKDKIKTYISYSLGRPYEFEPHQIIFGHTHIPIRNGNIDISVDGRSRNVAVFNTGGWVVDSNEPNEVIRSRPMPFLISDEGEVEHIDVPWPYDEGTIENMEGADIIKFIQEGKF